VVGRDKRSREIALLALKAAKIPAYSFQYSPTGEISPEVDAVRVSSLHGAKGHEFATVIIVGAAAGTVPQATAREQDELASEAAVLYVGMTRARDLLYLSYAQKDRNGRPRGPSPFITRINAFVDHAEFRR
jgi:superfamily I DNA/RNA helicase